jgi:soluble lytic murein transglycosylase-like protein
MPGWFKGGLLGCLLLGLVSGPALAAHDVHVYRQPDGVRLYTDRKLPNPDYVYISKYGRPVAVASCTGLSGAAMDQRHRHYENLITKYARQYGVEVALVSAVMRVESCFDPNAVSRVGARGLMQLMPATAAEMGVSNSFDPAQNIRGGVRYLSQMLARFGNNQKLALAAYNAGPAAVQRHGGVPPFRETRAYVNKVRTQYERYRG